MQSILYIFRRNRKKTLIEWEQGTSPSEFFYGMIQISNKGIDVDFVEGDDTTKEWRRLLCYPFELLVSIRVRIGFGIHIIWQNWKKISKSEIIISTVDTCGLPLLMFKSMGWLKQPIIYFSQGLSDRLENLPDNVINRFIIKKYTKWIHCADGIMVLGKGAAISMEKVFNLPPGSVTVNPFGIDTDFWTPGDKEGSNDFILSIGSDQGRDYDTLLKSISDDKPLHIVTRLKVNNGSDLKHVSVKSDYDNLQLRELYRNCRFVVIPLKDISQPSGQSATLQAMSCGKTVILTKTRGLWDPSIMQHNKNCVLVPVGDSDELGKEINKIWKNSKSRVKIGKQARESVQEHYSCEIFAGKILLDAEEILGSQDK